MATLLSQLTKQPLHGPRIVLLLHRLLPPGLVAAIEVINCSLQALTKHGHAFHTLVKVSCAMLS